MLLFAATSLPISARSICGFSGESGRYLASGDSCVLPLGTVASNFPRYCPSLREMEIYWHVAKEREDSVPLSA